MLRKSQRLSTNDFIKVIKNGRGINSSIFQLKWLVSDENINKIAISAVAPKKIAKTAVERNRLRRRIYSSVRPLVKDISKSIQAVIISKEPAKKASTNDMASDLRTLFVKVGIME